MLPLVVFVLAFTLPRNRLTNGQKSTSTQPLVPWFIYGFVGLSLLPTLGLVSLPTQELVGECSTYALVIAMVGIGVRIEPRCLFNIGKLAFFVGSVVFLLQVLFSGFLIYLLTI